MVHVHAFGLTKGKKEREKMKGLPRRQSSLARRVRELMIVDY